MNYTGMELYRGPSLLDGSPIVVILTLHSRNDKTGDMCQVYILRADMPPREAVESGEDKSICGECRHRHHTGGACYVIPWQAPTRVWRTWQAGKYPVATSRHYNRIRGRAIRFGAYGDPAAAPVAIWERLSKVANSTTGYTHQVAKLESLDLLNHCMVSVDSEAEAIFYQGMKARTFRVKRPEEPILENEVYCPYYSPSEVQCIDCGLCSSAYGNGKSVVVNVHGQRAKRFQDSLIASA